MEENEGMETKDTTFLFIQNRFVSSKDTLLVSLKTFCMDNDGVSYL